MDNDQVCYTFDAALEMAIAMEEEGFRNYLAAIRQLTNKGAKELLRGNALDELNHKQQLEKALWNIISIPPTTRPLEHTR